MSRYFTIVRQIVDVTDDGGNLREEFKMTPAVEDAYLALRDGGIDNVDRITILETLYARAHHEGVVAGVESVSPKMADST